MHAPPPFLVGLSLTLGWVASIADDSGRAPERAARVPSEGVRLVPNPARADSGRSNLYADAQGTVYLTWTEPSDEQGARRLQLAALLPGETGWSAPRTVVSSPLLMENWADFPSLVIAADGTYYSQWYQNADDGHHGHGYSGWHARSTDEGRTWSAPEPLGHEFVSMAPLPGGDVLTVWLQSVGELHGPQTPGSPAMELRSRLLSSSGATLGEWVVDPDVCTCCQTALVTLPDGGVETAYRGHTKDEVRDILQARFDGHRWGAPRRVHADDWRIEGCPVNGPAADRSGNHLGIAWFTAAGGVPRVLARVSGDGGSTYGAVMRLDLGAPLGRVEVVALERGGCVVFWLETDGQAAGLQARLVSASGTLSEPVLVAPVSSGRLSGFPRAVARTGETLLVTWTDAREAPTRVSTAELNAERLRQ